MLLLLEIGMLVTGITALIVGQVSFTRDLVVRGLYARLAGGLMVMPLPVALIMAVSVPPGRGARELDIRRSLVLIELFVTFGCLVSAVALGGVGTLQSSRRPRRRRAEKGWHECELPHPVPASQDDDDAWRRGSQDYESPSASRQERSGNALPWILAGVGGGGLLLLTIIVVAATLSGSSSNVP